MITREHAWQLLGSKPEYQPTRPKLPATGFILYRLNRIGALHVDPDFQARSDASDDDTGTRAYDDEAAG